MKWPRWGVASPSLRAVGEFRVVNAAMVVQPALDVSLGA